MKFWVVVLLMAGTVGGLGAAMYFSAKAADASRQAEIAEANLAAARDTITRYADSVSATTSLMQTQADVNQDSITELLASLDNAIDGRRQTLRALNTLRVEFSTLRDEMESVNVQPVKGSPEAEEAEFTVVGPPVEGNLWVTYRPNLPWSLQTELTASPFSMVYSVGCEGNNAIVNITTPTWVNTSPERGTIAPDVCNPVKPRPILSFSWDRAIWAAGGGLLGAVIAMWVDDGFRTASY